MPTSLSDKQIPLFDLEGDKYHDPIVELPKPEPAPENEGAPQHKPDPVAVKPARKKTRKIQKRKNRSGLVPEGDVRLTANIREDLHLRLKIAAAKSRTTVGEIIEHLVEQYVP